MTRPLTPTETKVLEAISGEKTAKQIGEAVWPGSARFRQAASAAPYIANLVNFGFVEARLADDPDMHPLAKVYRRATKHTQKGGV